MTYFNALQLLLAAVALALIAERFRSLFYRARIDAGPYLAALRYDLQAGRIHAARELAETGRPAWIPELVHAVLRAETDGEQAEGVADEVCANRRDDAGRGIYLLHGLARAATPLALLGVILELSSALSGRGAGLQALQAGSVQNIALSRALSTLAIGIATSAVCFVASGMLRKRALALVKDLRQTMEILEGEAGRDDASAESSFYDRPDDRPERR